MLLASPDLVLSRRHSSAACRDLQPFGPVPAGTRVGDEWVVEIRCAGDTDEDDEDLGDEEDLAVPEPAVDEESVFDDFDDEFDDDFEEEENDPDWDHPEDTESDEPPPAKGPGRKK